MLSDLRDSGCLSGNTLIPMADSGRRVPIRDLVGQSGFAVWALNEETLKIEHALVSHAFSTGVKPVYKLTTRLGRSISATANHQFRTFEGWKRLDELTEGDYLALPRKLASSVSQTISDSELALLGHLIGDGCTLPRHVMQYTTREKDLAEQVVALTTAVFGNEVRPYFRWEHEWYQAYLASTRQHTHGVHSAVTDWLKQLGVYGLRSFEKQIPELVFEQPAEAIALFLRHLWATDGCIRLRKTSHGFYPAVFYASSSAKLAQDVHSLLLRLEINARIKRVPQNGKGRDQYHVLVSGKPDLVRFTEVVGAVGAYKTSCLEQVAEHIQPLTHNTNRDVIPHRVWREHVVPAMQVQGMTGRQMQAAIGQPYCGTSLYKQNVSRERALRVAQAVNAPAVVRFAESDLYWDKLASIELEGETEVFDLTVPGPHNFIANDIVVHNSIEQDSDVVLFIYRDEYYNPDTTERPNIAEISIAKHRNGPTGVIDLYWHGQLASFRNLQRQEIQL